MVKQKRGGLGQVVNKPFTTFSKNECLACLGRAMRKGLSSQSLRFSYAGIQVAGWEGECVSLKERRQQPRLGMDPLRHKNLSLLELDLRRGQLGSPLSCRGDYSQS